MMMVRQWRQRCSGGSGGGGAEAVERQRQQQWRSASAAKLPQPTPQPSCHSHHRPCSVALLPQKAATAAPHAPSCNNRQLQPPTRCCPAAIATAVALPLQPSCCCLRHLRAELAPQRFRCHRRQATTTATTLLPRRQAAIATAAKLPPLPPPPPPSSHAAATRHCRRRGRTGVK